MSDWRDDLTDAEDAGGAAAAWLDRLLDGPGADEGPAELEPLAGLLLAARAPATDDELAGEAAAVDAFRSAMTPAVRPGVSSGWRTRRVAVVAALAVVTATGAAAAAGRLPADVQDVTSELLDHLGIDVPRSHERRPDVPPQRAEPGPASATAPTVDDSDPPSPPSSEPSPPAIPPATPSATIDAVAPPATIAPAPDEPSVPAPTETLTAQPDATVPPPPAPEAAAPPQGGGRPETVPGSEHGTARAVGRPADIPANEHAAANAGGPPAEVPPAPEVATPEHPGKGHGPPADVPANEHAAPHP